jgi:hypothetical protein
LDAITLGRVPNCKCDPWFRPRRNLVSGTDGDEKLPERFVQNVPRVSYLTNGKLVLFEKRLVRS